MKQGKCVQYVVNSDSSNLEGIPGAKKAVLISAVSKIKDVCYFHQNYKAEEEFIVLKPTEIMLQLANILHILCTCCINIFHKDVHNILLGI